MKHAILKTNPADYSLLICRLALGLVMLPHGLQKTFGLFGGGGFAGSMQFLSGAAGGSKLVAFLIIIGESVGALALIFGFMTRFCAASLGIIMLGAILLVHGQNGFFAGNNGFELHLLAIGLALALTVGGGGAWSADGALVDGTHAKK